MKYLDEYLESLGCELWPGEAFYLTDPVSRMEAVDWVQRLQWDYYEWEAKKYPDMHREPGC